MGFFLRDWESMEIEDPYRLYEFLVENKLCKMTQGPKTFSGYVSVTSVDSYNRVSRFIFLVGGG